MDDHLKKSVKVERDRTNQDIIIKKDQVITTLLEALPPKKSGEIQDFASGEGWTQQYTKLTLYRAWYKTRRVIATRDRC